jgi:hypothetical protein
MIENTEATNLSALESPNTRPISTIQPGKDPTIRVHYFVYGEDELPEAIHKLTPKQQEAILVIASHPSYNKQEVADSISSTWATVDRWTDAEPFHSVYWSTRALASEALPNLAIAHARQHTLTIMERSVEVAESLDPEDTAATITAKAKLAEMVFKGAGLLKDNPTIQINAGQILLEAAKERQERDPTRIGRGY